MKSPDEKLRTCATISVEEAAGLLGIGRSTAYNAVRNGSLPAIKLEGRWLVVSAKLREMLGIGAA